MLSRLKQPNHIYHPKKGHHQSLLFFRLLPILQPDFKGLFGVLDFSRTTFLILYFCLGASWFFASTDMTTTIANGDYSPPLSGNPRRWDQDSWLFDKGFNVILNLVSAIFKDKWILFINIFMYVYYHLFQTLSFSSGIFGHIFGFAFLKEKFSLSIGMFLVYEM